MRRALIGATVFVVALAGAAVPSASGQTGDTDPAGPTSSVPDTTIAPTPPLPDDLTTTTASSSTTTTTVPQATTTTAPGGVRAQAIGVPGIFVGEAPDFATDVWSDPWDMRNPDDILRNFGPTYRVAGPQLTGDQLVFALTGQGFVSPLWPGYGGSSLSMGRDGKMTRNKLNANQYKFLSIRMFTSAPLSGAGIFWFNCGGQKRSCMGGMPVAYAGTGNGQWHTYTFRLANDRRFNLPASWSGNITGLRLALNAAAGTTPAVRIDWIRLYQSGSGSLSGVNPNAPLYYRQVGGACEQISGEGKADLSALPPATYEFSSAANCASPSSPVAVLSRPTPVVQTPSELGGLDYAAAKTGNPWDFNDAGDVATTANVCAKSFALPQGAFSGQNCNQNGHPNDPHVYLRVGAGPNAILSSRFHRVTVRFDYDGPFNLEDKCGGGTIARLMWLDSKHRGQIMQTKDWITWSDRSTYTFDLGQSTAKVIEPGTTFHSWKLPAGYYVTALRWDPNEDRCARRFRIHDVKLTADESPFFGVFNITWRDPRAQSGDQVAIYVQNTSVRGAPWRPIASGLQNSATGASFPWVTNTGAFGPGKWAVLVRVFRNGSPFFGDFKATGPVRI